MNLKLILAAVCLGGSALALEENFSKVDESGFAPGWEAQSIDWAVRQGALFHYCSPHIVGDPAQIVPLCDASQYYQALAGWSDRAHSRAVGCWAPRGGKLTGFFWKDAPTAFHADMREPADVLLKPGATWTAAPEPLLWFAVSDAGQAASAAAARRAAEQAGL